MSNEECVNDVDFVSYCPHFKVIQKLWFPSSMSMPEYNLECTVTLYEKLI